MNSRRCVSFFLVELTVLLIAIFHSTFTVPPPVLSPLNPTFQHFSLPHLHPHPSLPPSLPPSSPPSPLPPSLLHPSLIPTLIPNSLPPSPLPHSHCHPFSVTLLHTSTYSSFPIRVASSHPSWRLTKMATSTVRMSWTKEVAGLPTAPGRTTTPH